MIKQALSVAFLTLISMSVLADVPHVVPAPGCPAGQICCPIQVVCDYLNGCGTSYWLQGGYTVPYTGLKIFNLSKIQAASNDRVNYDVQCYYGSEQSTIDLVSPLNLGLVGDAWQYGFNKMQATCLNTDSTQCSGKPR